MNRTFRDIKRQARRQIHDTLSEPAWYIAAPGATPVPVTVRLHLRFNTLGELLTDTAGYADRQELTPRIIFMNDQVDPKHTGVVVTYDLGAFVVDSDVAPDDITTTGMVKPITTAGKTKMGLVDSVAWMGLGEPFAGE